jgi:hypothetical protein
VGLGERGCGGGWECEFAVDSSLPWLTVCYRSQSVDLIADVRRPLSIISLSYLADLSRDVLPRFDALKLHRQQARLRKRQYQHPSPSSRFLPPVFLLCHLPSQAYRLSVFKSSVRAGNNERQV